MQVDAAREIEAALDGGANFGDHADDWQRYPFANHSRRRMWRIVNSVRKPAIRPTEHPNPANSGRVSCSRTVISMFRNTGIAATNTGGHERFSAKSDRDVISSKLQPIRLGPSPRNA